MDAMGTSPVAARADGFSSWARAWFKSGEDRGKRVAAATCGAGVG